MSEALTGLRRNKSMAISLIVTLTVSLLLAALGLLMQQQADRNDEHWGERLQLTVVLCYPDAQTDNCLDDRHASDEERAAVEQLLNGHPEVREFEHRTLQDNLDRAEQLLGQTETGRAQLSTLTIDDVYESYFVTLHDPHQFEGILAELETSPGVHQVSSLREVLEPIFEILDKIGWAAFVAALILIVAAILQVTNTVRMTAIVRAREIGIMRLVGASQWHIQWPFILEAIVAALVAAALACAGLAAFMYFVVYGYLRETLGEITLWVSWTDAFLVMGATTLISLALAVIPTLIVTRRHLDV